VSGKAWGAACVLAGLALAAGGWKVLKSQEHPPGTTGFEGLAPNRRGLALAAGYGMLILGLVLSVLIGSFFFIGG
jgi:hypothetical protein